MGFWGVALVIAVFVALLVIRVRWTLERFEAVVGGTVSPPEIFRKIRTLLERYDRPEVWEHAQRVKDMDPGQLARMNLDQQ